MISVFKQNYPGIYVHIVHIYTFYRFICGSSDVILEDNRMSKYEAELPVVYYSHYFGDWQGVLFIHTLREDERYSSP